MSRNNKSFDDNIYHLLHEFFELEEIEQSMPEIAFNLKELRFLDNHQSYSKRFFGIINCLGPGVFSDNDILLPNTLSLAKPSGFLFRVISSNVLVKIIFKIEL